MHHESISGGIGFSIGKEKESTTNTNTEKGYLTSTVGSTEGNLAIKAGQDLGVKGSDVIAKGDVSLQGQNVNIAADDAQTHSREEYKYEKSGLTVALTGTAADVYQAKQAIDSAKDRDNDTLLALQSIKGGLTVAGAGLDSKIKNNQGDTQASIGVNVSIGSQKTERTINEETHSVVGSGVSAGQNVTIKATGNDAKTDGDITVQGSQVQAGKDITLEANRDLNVLGAVNTQHTDKDETSSGSSMGVGVSVGGNQPGVTVSGSANYSRERENADGSNWTQGTVTAGNNLNVKTGQDANLIGGQLKGDSVTADIGHDLNIKSLQDSDNYDYEKLSGSVSGSVGSGWSANLSETKTDINSKWASVTEQSGIMAGKGGYDVTVENNTDLKGAVISSKAEDKSNNKLDTGTISFSDIKNKADYQVDSETVNIGIGTGLIPSVGAPSIYHNGDSASSTTKSAVEEGTLTVRDKENQQQNVDDLSRNTEDANNPLAHIFDKQKEQDKIEQQQLINDIAAQMKDVANKYDRIQAQNEVDKHPALVDKAAEEAYNKLSAEEKAKTSLAEFTAANKDSLYYTAVDTQVKNSKENIGGIGSSVNKGIDAATSVITGILTGNIVGGLAGAGAPYIAEQIKLHTGHQESDGSWKMDDPNANLIAHAILGGVVAQLQGNSALAGAAGAAGGEFIADQIRKNLYGDRPVEDLTQSEKQNLSNLTQLATGLATALASGGDMGDTSAAVNAGKNAVENNYGAEVILDEYKQDYRDGLLLSDGDKNKAAEYANQKMKDRSVASGITIGALTGGAVLPEAAIIGGSLSGGINAGAQYIFSKDGSINWTDVGIASGVGVITGGYGTGFWGTVGLNAAGGATSSYLNDQNPIIEAVAGGISSGVGYFVGKVFQGTLQKVLNPISKEYEMLPVGIWTITKPVPQNPIPAYGGGILDSGGSEWINHLIEQRLEGSNNEKK